MKGKELGGKVLKRYNNCTTLHKTKYLLFVKHVSFNTILNQNDMNTN